MPRLDYYKIEEAIQTILKADTSLVGVHVEVEDEVIFGAESCPWLGIYLMSRSASSHLQGLSAGQRTRFQLNFSLWAWEYSLESQKDVMQRRDDLIGKVEVVLMNNRTLSVEGVDNVAHLWLDGGDMSGGRDE